MKQLELEKEKYTELRSSKGIDAALSALFNDMGSKGSLNIGFKDMLNTDPTKANILIKANDVFIQIEDPEDQHLNWGNKLVSEGNTLQEAKESLLHDMLYHDNLVSDIFSGLTKLVVVNPKTKEHITKTKIYDYQYAC